MEALCFGEERNLLFDICRGLGRCATIFAESIAEVEAGVAELADAPDLGSGGEIRRGSSPLPGTAQEVAVH